VSANTVGYQQQDYRKSFQLGLPTFNMVGGTGMHIQNLIPSGEYAGGAGGINIQTLNTLNQRVKSFYWLTDDDFGTDDGDDGWFEDKDATGTDDLADYTFAPGEGFLFYSGSGAINLTVSGEVKYPTSVPCVKSFQVKGNYLPIPVSIQDIIPSGEYAGGAGCINIQTLNTLNQRVKSFYWLTDDDFGTDDGDDGWFEDKDATGTDDLADYTFAPGEGFLLYSGSGAITLNFPEL
jgi:hypothetical protein